MKRGWYPALAAVAVVAAGLTWTGLPSAQAQSSDLDWSDCGGRAQCATLTVPVDWNDPDGPTTRVNLAKLPARDPGAADRPLLVNLGAGNTTAALEADQVPPGVAALNERFDVIGFDPRGLGKDANDTLIHCAESQAPYPGLVLAENAEDWRAHAKRNAKYEQSCREAAGAEYAGLTSTQIAHDMDALRTALDQPKLKYFGNSYGTSYGQAYAELFGDKVERMYLDGVADHTQPKLSDWLTNYARTTEQQLTEFADWCSTRDGCALNGEDAAKVWDDLVKRAESEPIPAPGAGDGETVDVRELLAGGHFGLTPPSWPRLAVAMDSARDGDASDFLTELVWPPDTGKGGHVQGALLCNDFMPEQLSYRQTLKLEQRLRDIAPRIGWVTARAELSRCVGMDAKPANPPHRLDVDDLPPVLVGIGDLDANTPHHGAENLASQLPDASVLRHGDGHAAFVLGNKCLAKHVTAYFADGTLPDEGTRCPGELVDQIPDKP